MAVDSRCPRRQQLTERDALMATLLPSLNNIAVLVARQVDGSVASFVTEMNRTAHALGIPHDLHHPSGFDEHSVSTALDQLRLAQAVADNPTLAVMMATRSYSLPAGGEVTKHQHADRPGRIRRNEDRIRRRGRELLHVLVVAAHRRRQRNADRRRAQAERTQPDHLGPVCGQATGRPPDTRRSNP